MNNWILSFLKRNGIFQHEKDTVEIYQFISRNASQFVDLDPVQLALLESNKSAPCSQAKEIVAECMKNSSSRGKLYFQLM